MHVPKICYRHGCLLAWVFTGMCKKDVEMLEEDGPSTKSVLSIDVTALSTALN